MQVISVIVGVSVEIEHIGLIRPNSARCAQAVVIAHAGGVDVDVIAGVERAEVGEHSAVEPGMAAERQISWHAG